MRTTCSMILVVSSIVGGCKRASKPTAMEAAQAAVLKPTASRPAVGKPAASGLNGTYKIEVRGADGSLAKGTYGSPVFIGMGPMRISIKDGLLIINGRGYGALEDGDSILIDEAGIVKVNGKPRLGL